MGVSLNWLKEYVDTKWTSEDIAHNLTMAGIAIEGVEKVSNDEILDLDLTPNRGDCLGLINLAREVAALNETKLKLPEIKIEENSEDVNDYIKVDINDVDLCKRYAARVIKNVKVEESPQWLQDKLINSGIRPINNIVDITNYVMLETNQPLHGFDYDLLSEKKHIIVRRAKDQEKLTTLDGVERELDSQMLVITEGDTPVALAGVMGGESTEINDSTVTVLLESANFEGISIRKTSKRLGLRSDSSVRFEKGADVNGVIYAINRATQLIQDIANGEVVKGICDAYPKVVELKKVELRPERVNFILGTELTAEEIKNYLLKLKFNVTDKGNKFVIDVPSYRPDIEMEVDLIEEVARLYGYDNIPSVLPASSGTEGGLNKKQKFTENLKLLLSHYLYEVINYSFISPKYFDMINEPEESPLREVVTIANPLSEEQSVMRTILLPGLLDTVSRNLARKNTNLALFEIGSVFIKSTDKLPDEKPTVAAIVAGSLDNNWLNRKTEMDFYYLKGIVEEVFLQLGIKDYSFEEFKGNAYHPGRSALIKVNNQDLGIIGEVHPLVLENFNIKPRACAFELDLDLLFELSTEKRMSSPITKFPTIERDLAIVLNDEIKAADVLDVVKANGSELLTNIHIFDIYTGDQVPEGCKSIALRMTYQSFERTLTDDDVNPIIETIIKTLEEKFNASLR
ncbi:Phenylalanyl-tRNA synthetase beta chain [Candidatus Syntrophocurvum alkaliphilum]|uniref:Phenylalanine--tRNA ligase beta subunit n=1 Tax=Candidatus Syntrophocurvum alkaliphilum TaxID=2293317 RepID=A0A6I6DAE9_9FIRM|nr:phenylalanine--tRNA ligase subunit beta [Candidatus Syntrophocurvum alkaliphilum]QGT99715.1 Phenylalanyl-tRNA synthetase beta chain [Candidatus Syntrophocurvum alkaliphilum]